MVPRPWGMTALVLLAVASLTALVPPAAAEGTSTGATPREVTVGMYVYNVQAIDIETNSFHADFYVWLRWRGSDFRPYEGLEIMNTFEQWQLIATPVYDEPVPQPDGSLYYAIRYEGAFNSPISLRTFPFGEQVLYLVLGNSQYLPGELALVPDDTPMSLNPKITLPGYQLRSSSFVVGDQTYRTDFGDLRYPGDQTYPEATASMRLSAPVLSSVVKFLVPILLVIIAASLIFQIPSSMVEARIGLGITALLTLVAMQWTAGEGLPFIDYLTLLDGVYLLSITFVIATIIQAIRSTWIAAAGDEARAIALDRRAMAIYLAVYLIALGLTVWLFLLPVTT